MPRSAHLTEAVADCQHLTVTETTRTARSKVNDERQASARHHLATAAAAVEVRPRRAVKFGAFPKVGRDAAHTAIGDGEGAAATATTLLSNLVDLV